MNNNDGDFFDLTQIYDLDGREFKNNDNLTEMLGYDFLNENTAGTDLRNNNVNYRGNENVEEDSSNRTMALDKIDKSLEVGQDLNILNEEVFNLENVSLKDFLETQTGKIANIEANVATNQLINRTGMILAVGEEFILLKEAKTDDILICPFKNIEFIKLSEL